MAPSAWRLRRGGIATVGGIGTGADWRLMYYNAGQDAITVPAGTCSLAGWPLKNQ